MNEVIIGDNKNPKYFQPIEYTLNRSNRRHSKMIKEYPNSQMGVNGSVFRKLSKNLFLILLFVLISLDYYFYINVFSLI